MTRPEQVRSNPSSAGRMQRVDLVAGHDRALRPRRRRRSARRGRARPSSSASHPFGGVLVVVLEAVEAAPAVGAGGGVAEHAVLARLERERPARRRWSRGLGGRGRGRSVVVTPAPADEDPGADRRRSAADRRGQHATGGGGRRSAEVRVGRGWVPSRPPRRWAADGRRSGLGSRARDEEGPEVRRAGPAADARSGPAAARCISTRGSAPTGAVRAVAGQGEEQGGPEGEHVRGRGGVLAPRLLGGHERRGADDRRGGREAGGVVRRCGRRRSRPGGARRRR